MQGPNPASLGLARTRGTSQQNQTHSQWGEEPRKRDSRANAARRGFLFILGGHKTQEDRDTRGRAGGGGEVSQILGASGKTEQAVTADKKRAAPDSASRQLDVLAWLMIEPLES